MLFRLSTFEARIVEQPMETRYGDETSHLSPLHALLTFPTLHLRNLTKRIGYTYFLRNFSAASLNLLGGLALGLSGFAIGVAAWLESSATGTPATAGTVMLGAMPLLIGILTALIVSRRCRWGHTINTLGLVLSTGYLAWTLGAKMHVEHVARNAIERQHMADTRLLTTPTPFNSLLWRVLAVDADSYYEGYYSVFDDSSTIVFKQYPRAQHLIEPLSDYPPVQRLQWFTKDFYAAALLDDAIVISDLRMGYEPDYVFSFAVAELDKLKSAIYPRVVVSYGNQLDVDPAGRHRHGEAVAVAAGDLVPDLAQAVVHPVHAGMLEQLGVERQQRGTCHAALARPGDRDRPAARLLGVPQLVAPFLGHERKIFG